MGKGIVGYYRAGQGRKRKYGRSRRSGKDRHGRVGRAGWLQVLVSDCRFDMSQEKNLG